MKRVQIHPVNPHKRIVKQVADAIADGQVVICPTGAGYSIACGLQNKKTIQRMYDLKRNIKKYVMSLVVADFASMNHFVEVENYAFRYMKDKLPGPYTFILPATKEGKKLLDVKRVEIGIRMPDHPFFDVLHEFSTEPLITTAAKVHEDDYFVEPDEILEKFGKSVDLLVDAGPVPIEPTSIISFVNGEPELVREGDGLID